MPNAIIKCANVSKLSARLNQPFRIATGQHNTLENVLFTLELEDGTQGFGEAAVATHITGETIEETTRNLESIGQGLIGQDIADYLSIANEAGEKLSKNRCALAAVEMAILDALTRQLKIPLWKFFGIKNGCRQFATDITIVLGTLEEAEKSTRTYYQKGFRAFKIKIGKDQDLDFKRVQLIHKIS